MRSWLIGSAVLTGCLSLLTIVLLPLFLSTSCSTPNKMMPEGPKPAGGWLPNGIIEWEAPIGVFLDKNLRIRYEFVTVGAINWYNKLVGCNFLHFTYDENSAKIVIEPSPPDGRHAGVMQYEKRKTGYKAVLSLKTLELATYKQFHVIKHEIGHAIGLAHSPNKTSIMYATGTIDKSVDLEEETRHALYEFYCHD